MCVCVLDGGKIGEMLRLNETRLDEIDLLLLAGAVRLSAGVGRAGRAGRPVGAPSGRCGGGS